MGDPRDVLLVGCGDLGTRVGLRLAARGHRVFGIRRHVDGLPPEIRGLGADLTQGPPALPEDLDLEHVVVALTARPRTEEAYRATYVEGMGRALDALDAAGHRPRRSVLVSSTAVYGDLPPDPLVDEETVPAPTDGPGRMLRASEELFARRLGDDGGTVLRLSGLYGASTRLLDQVRSGRVTDPDRWTNRLHRDDAAGAVVHLLTMPETPAPVYVGTDDEPAQLGDVAAYLAERMAAPEPPGADPSRGHGKRLSNARLRAAGWVPQYPTFREGYLPGT